MSDSTPTSEQLAAISSDAPEFVVLASAGSGKTYVLTERYLRFVIDQGIEPDQILTITFTRKAAAEMKGRIVAALRERGLLHSAQIAETGPIQTIHSFCERLLRENILECGLDPQFEILPEGRSSRLKIDSIRAAIVEAPSEIPQAERVIRDFVGHLSYNSSGAPYRHLESCIEHVLESLRSSGKTVQEIRAIYASFESVREFWERSVVNQIENEGVREAIKAIHGGTLTARIARAYKELGLKAPKHLTVAIDPLDEERAVQHTCGIVLLACSAWERLEAQMFAQQSLDFTMLESLAVTLLSESQKTRDRLARQFKVVMVDEVQDVNPVQFELLKALQTESRMYVGDTKQSIYAFRHADVEKFREQTANLPTLRLTKNFRSSESIQRFVDDLFSKLMGADYERMLPPKLMLLNEEDPFDDPVSYSDVEFWKAVKGDPRIVGNYVAELIAEGFHANQIAIIVQSNAAASTYASVLEQLNIRTRILGGSEMFYTRLEVRELSNVLRAVAEPHDDFPLLATLRGDMVGLSLDAVVLLANSKPVIEALPTFVSPIDSDNEKLQRFLKWYRPLQQIGDRLSAWEVISEVLAKSSYLETLARKPQADQQIANVRKLLALAASEPELGPLDYAERIRETIELRPREGDAPTASDDDSLVTLLTIHKAKGLQFDVVVLPETFKPIATPSGDIAIEAREGRVAVKMGSVITPMYAQIRANKEQKEFAERMRTLYVALTRPRKRLCICIYPPSNRETLSRRIVTVMGESPPGVRIRQRKEDAQTST